MVKCLELLRNLLFYKILTSTWVFCTLKVFVSYLLKFFFSKKKNEITAKENL